MFLAVLTGLLVLGTGAARAAPDVLDGPTAGVTSRIADPNTMDTYIQDLLGGGSKGANDSGTRYAGRIWADKTVFANGRASNYVAGDDGRDPWDEKRNELWLDEETDGVPRQAIRTGEDFLHVFSTLGSSLAFNERYTTPLDVVIVLDISGSMAHGVSNDDYESSRIYKTLMAVNDAIETLARANPDNRIGIVVYGYTAAQYLPLVYPNPRNILKLDLDDTFGQGAGETGEGKPVHLRDYGVGTSLGPAKEKGEDGNFQILMRGEAARAEEEGSLGSPSGHRYKDISQVVENVRVNNYWTSKPVPTAPAETLTPCNVGNYTNLQAGIAAGGEMLATEKVRTWVSDTTGRSYDRVPVLMIMTDGVANTLCRSTADGGAEQYSPTAWWRPQYEAKWFGTRDYSICEHQQPDYAPGIAVGTVMTAAYYKAAIDSNYAVPSRFFGIGVDIDELIDDSSHDYLNGAIIESILNPSVAFDGDSENSYIAAAHASYQEWAKASAEVEVRNKTKVYLRLGQLPEGDEGALNGVTKDDVKKSIGYIAPNDFITTDSDTMTSVFSEVIASIMSPISAPIGGVNSLGAEDAITYMDPLGHAMELKNPCTSGADPSATGDLQMSLFGELHDYVRAGVYDRRWNEGRDGFEEGWYLGEDPATALAATAVDVDAETGATYPTASGDAATGFERSRDAWIAGWTYRLGEDTLAEFVPLEEGDERTGDAVYTVYRLDLPSEERSAWRLNPAYGEASGAPSEDTSGAYRLSDIRVWVEDTGPRTDGEGGGDDVGYERTLMVNVPVDALPLQTASVTLGSVGAGDSEAVPTAPPYGTNLADFRQSTPLRLYYSVGVEDRLLDENGAVDAGLLDEAYGEGHGSGEIVFDANHFDRSESAGGDSGNAVVTFTSTKTNGYYAFQGRTPLYEIRCDSPEGIDDHPDEVELTDPSGQVGPEGLKIAGEDFPVVTNVLLTGGDEGGQRQPAVDGGGGTLRADGWYYIVIDYYLPPTAEAPDRPVLVQRAVKRRGSDFGAGDGSTDVPFGGHLCWFLPPGTEGAGDGAATFPIAVDVGGRTELTPWPGEGYVVGTAIGGLRAGAVAKDVEAKAPNLTGTAGAAHFPTIAHVDSPEGDGASGLAMSIYLGNNGTERLSVEGSDPDPDPTPDPGTGTTPSPVPDVKPKPDPDPDPDEDDGPDREPDPDPDPGEDGHDEPGGDPDPGTADDPGGDQGGGSGPSGGSDPSDDSDSGSDDESGTRLVPVPYVVGTGPWNGPGGGTGTTAKPGALAKGLRQTGGSAGGGELPKTGDGMPLGLSGWMGALGMAALLASLLLVRTRR